MDKKAVIDKVIEILERLNKASEKELIMAVGPTQKIRFHMDIFTCVNGLLDKVSSKMRTNTLNVREIMINAYDCMVKVRTDRRKLVVSDEVAKIVETIIEEVIKGIKEGKLTIEDIHYLRILLENVGRLVVTFGM